MVHRSRLSAVCVAALAVVGMSGFSALGVLSAPPAQAAPREQPSRLMPLDLTAPAQGRVGRPVEGIRVRLLNDGGEAPPSRLRVLVRETDHRHEKGHVDLTPSTLQVEVRDGGNWIPVALGVVDGGVIGAIGSDGVSAHTERHARGGFALPPGLDKSWPLRMTFKTPGTYTVVVSVSPDNGSRHLARPVFKTIEVR